MSRSLWTAAAVLCAAVGPGCGDVDPDPTARPECELDVTQINGESAGSRERVASFESITALVEGADGFAGNFAVFAECYVNEDDEFAAFEGELFGFEVEASTGTDPVLYRIDFTLGARFAACDMEFGDASSMEAETERRCTPARIRLLHGE